MKKEIIQIAVECAQSSTSHALPKIVNNKNLLLKVVWTICLLGSAAYCIFNLSKSFIHYFDYETTSFIETQRISSIEFPTVTFCSKNPFNPKRLQSNDNDNIKKSINQIKSTLNGNISIGSILYFMANVEHESLLNVITYKNLLDKVGYQLDDLLVDCRFRDMKCGLDDFVNITIPKFGNCFQFNSGKLINGKKISIKQSNVPGVSVGLKLVLSGGLDDPEIDLFKHKGIQLFVHNSTTIPFGEFDYLNLAMGFETDIVVSQKLTKKLPNPYSRCIADTNLIDSFNSRIYRQTVTLLGKYNQKTCLNICWYEYIFDKCKCYYPDFFAIDLSNMCTNQEVECINNALIYLDHISSDFFRQCFESCPEECEVSEYGFKISMTDFANEFFYETFKNFSNISLEKIFVNLKKFRENVLIVNIYHDDIAMTFVQEKPIKSVEELIADIGGFLGLCAGVSLLTIAEIFDILVKILLLLVKKKKIGTELSINLE